MAESAARIEALTRLQQRWGAGIIRRGVEVRSKHLEGLQLADD